MKGNNISSDLIKITKQIIGSKTKNKKLIMVRSVENIGSLSGCLNGWLDAKISEYGRKQAKYLSIEYFSNFDNKNSFGNVFISDLLRAKETTDLCLGFDYRVNYMIQPELREIYFGESEGLFYDGLPKEEKGKINKPNHKFANGESWLDVKYRCLKFLFNLPTQKKLLNEESNVDLVFTHGGFLTSLLKVKNLKGIPPNGSVLVIQLSENLQDEKIREKSKLLLDEYSSFYNCNNDDYDKTPNLFENFNPRCDEFFNKLVENIEIQYSLPDLAEELL
jgi:broad specificity phosphatase PhoE